MCDPLNVAEGKWFCSTVTVGDHFPGSNFGSPRGYCAMGVVKRADNRARSRKFIRGELLTTHTQLKYKLKAYMQVSIKKKKTYKFT